MYLFAANTSIRTSTAAGLEPHAAVASREKTFLDWRRNHECNHSGYCSWCAELRKWVLTASEHELPDSFGPIKRYDSVGVGIPADCTDMMIPVHELAGSELAWFYMHGAPQDGLDLLSGGR